MSIGPNLKVLRKYFGNSQEEMAIYNRGTDIPSIIKVLEAGNPVLITE